MTPTEKIKYIDDDMEKGILIDWKKVLKEYKKLNIPSDVYTPSHIPFTQAKYFVDCSERSIGKTTNWILLGMILYKMYGISIQYIRQILDMIMPRNLKLFRTILQFDYVAKITNGRFNNVRYDSREFYFYNTETGEKDDKPFMNTLSIDCNLEYKSSYNAPTGDMIIFDEFIGKWCRPNEFVDFEDLVKTIIRERKSPIVVMLANTIDKYHTYFKELEIYDDIQTMNIGESRLITTEMGTHVFVNLIGNVRPTKQKQEHNALFFGFKNQKLNSIRGGEWATNSYPHIPREEYESICKNHYVLFNSKLLRLNLVVNESVGMCVYVHEATQTYDDSIIYTTDFIEDKRYKYIMGFNALDKKIWSFYFENKFYYSDNRIGEMIKSYLKDCKYLKGGRLN